MTASKATHAAPPYALLCWTDDRYIYIELPTSLSAPVVQRFELCDAGLSKALNFLRTRYEELPSRQKNYTIPPSPVTMKNGKPVIQTEAQRTHALSVLRRMGIV